MDYLLLIIIGVVAVFSFVFWVAKKDAAEYGTAAKEEFVGICKLAIETASEKEARKQKVMALFEEKNPSTGSGRVELSNSEIRKALGVSSRTAVRYLDELEAEGKVKQVGNTGNAVTYRLK